ncbi:MAG: molybdopterin molybdotransferase MoeA [Candidatus Acidiferrum sp.]
MLAYDQARDIVIEQLTKHATTYAASRPTHLLDLQTALGHILAQEVKADREYPPFRRATRDGFAVRAEEGTPGASLSCVGEIKAGDTVTGQLASGTCVQIMTGAAVPPGADAVVMIEQTEQQGANIRFLRAAGAGQNIIPQGSEMAAGQIVLSPGHRLGYAELAVAAQVGATQLRCAKKPRVAILSTGDEVLAADASPGPFQIRNSNSVSLAAQVRLAGGEPVLLGIAADRPADLRTKIEAGLHEDMLVLAGGVSMGKHDLVESVLRELGAEFYFDAVAIRPGKPAVFGSCHDCPVFGLPGNPVSTMVTFELFVAPAIAMLNGAPPWPLPLVEASLKASLRSKPGLTHFLPAKITWPAMRATAHAPGPPEVTVLPWQGSSDLGAVAQANCYLVVAADREKIEAGERATVLLRRDVI